MPLREGLSMTRFFGGDTSPTNGKPSAAQCLRTWCFRPVLALQRSSANSAVCARGSICVAAGLPWAGQARAVLRDAHGQVRLFYASRSKFSNQ